MTVRAEKPSVNLREKLAELDKPTGIAGEAMLRADTVVDQAELLGYRQQNVIINGDMQIWQRGSGNTYGQNDGDFISDRWVISESGSALATTVRSGSRPDGFSHSAKLLLTAADTAADSTDVFMLRQNIEGYNLRKFASGTSNAKHHTLSFWVRSTVAGTYIAEIEYIDGSGYKCSKPYYINQADTWEYKVVVFPPQTLQEPTYDENRRACVNLFLMAGSNYTSSSSGLGETFHTTTSRRAVGQVNWTATTNNEFFFTGVQLVAGNYPDGLPFMHRSYGEELALCQRYYRTGDLNDGGATGFLYGAAGAANMLNSIHNFGEPMRAVPTASVGTPSYTNCSSIALSAYQNGIVSRVSVTSDGSYRAITATWTADAEL